ncbi:hypothetical protein BGX31_000352 [Mortierella sp. GBA43]|nr:hypothetical protein BGX31_000352 [Mortierella sp. GBA43]
MSSRYLMLIATIPVCYFAGYAYREYYDPDETATTLEESKLKVLKQLEEVEAHREKLKVAGKNVTDIPGRLW